MEDVILRLKLKISLNDDSVSFNLEYPILVCWPVLKGTEFKTKYIDVNFSHNQIVVESQCIKPLTYLYVYPTKYMPDHIIDMIEDNEPIPSIEDVRYLANLFLKADSGWSFTYSSEKGKSYDFYKMFSKMIE